MKHNRAVPDPRKLETLVTLVAMLRSPEGCPWDKKQTHSSIKSNLLEECYEVMDAIDSGDTGNLTEELGDVLFQIVFHAQMAEERGDFKWGDIVESINQKLLRRHPHVFGTVDIENSIDVQAQWDKIKQQERGRGCLLEGIPVALPALAYSQLMQDRAGRAGFDWEIISGVWMKLAEELAELENANSPEKRVHELGDVLLVLTNLARWLDVQSEEALRHANKRFASRFSHMEQLCTARGLSFANLSSSQKEDLWQQVKHLSQPPSHDSVDV